MSKEAMKLALEALEAGEYYIDDLEAIVYAADDLGTHEDREKMQAAITALREALAEQPAQQEPVPAAMKTVIQAMQQDPDYAWSWHCNIAMAFVDAGGDHYTGNQGAARFMKMLANVEPAHELPSPQPAQQEPVVWMYQDKSTHEVRFQKHMRGFVDHGATYETPLYITPPQRTWVGLTDEDIRQCSRDVVAGGPENSVDRFAYAIEAKLMEKNT